MHLEWLQVTLDLMFLMMKSDTVAWLHVLYCSLHEFTNMAALVGNILREYKTL